MNMDTPTIWWMVLGWSWYLSGKRSLGRGHKKRGPVAKPWTKLGVQAWRTDFSPQSPQRERATPESCPLTPFIKIKLFLELENPKWWLFTVRDMHIAMLLVHLALPVLGGDWENSLVWPASENAEWQALWQYLCSFQIVSTGAQHFSFQINLGTTDFYC